MDVTIEQLLLGVSVLLLLSVLSSTASGRLGVPALLLFLAIGMLAGSDGPGGIHFDDPFLAQSIGVVALADLLHTSGPIAVVVAGLLIENYGRHWGHVQGDEGTARQFLGVVGRAVEHGLVRADRGGGARAEF
ncbi:MAG: hypothetical protein NNA22_12285 [Nitrospira sp.]|nr:hypothetical protein [Nitrospira sp.]